ncbi:YqgE/AlgH family protein [Candidatus Tisiphia endosymbiont of Beris chalybata]|uniref:YqgE/AlgH family protein n=1 Tax=Candidatus Tisiphia endosymbiont of Beris chalybata TaxID=3066262 RepID=UPI00312C945A
MHVNSKIFDNLSGKVLISTPYMFEGIFNQSLIYMLSHTDEGAMGLIFNHLVNQIEVKSFFKIEDDQVPSNIVMPIYLGGPVEHERGFFLHSDDYDKNLLLKFQNHLAVSSNHKISYDIAAGQGPKDSLFIIGYTAWKAGQLEAELKDNLWIVLDSDKDFIFADHPENKWDHALEKLGIRKSHFTSRIGNA